MRAKRRFGFAYFLTFMISHIKSFFAKPILKVYLLKKNLAFILFFSFSFSFFSSLWQPGEVLSLVSVSSIFAQTVTATPTPQPNPTDERKVLEDELKALEEKIAQYEKDITKTQQEKKTLQNQVSILKNKIQKLDLQIKQNKLMIGDLGLQIKDTEGSIDKTTQKIEDLKIKLSSILRSIWEEDQKSEVELLLAEANLSGFFNNLVALESLNLKNKELLSEIKSLKVSLEDQKNSLDNEKGDLEQLARIQLLQKQENFSVKQRQEVLLEETKGKESEYQKMLEASKKRAAEIRTRIFELIGVPEAPTFGEALDIAKIVSAQTGVRPALLLAVLTQESNLGKNVGQCYLANADTGEGVRISTGKKEPRTMSPKRDVPNFLKITGELGKDSYKVPVSCPMSFGWGGAMGPAQFIPSTWMLYRDRVAAITGKSADPWNIRDAFFAAGLYLADYGAKLQTYDGEWRAAMIYFSGSTNTRYRFYGDSVMALAKQYQTDIETIEKGGLGVKY
ncbi:MAG: hypothetical protein COX90_01560 [Candidatus Nealsonbacteria bacterium CG_4_10_14_0_2_um_filter_38_17]|uniref:Transglycosylase SLT domain-containing protein n=2 Tax=Candidatus Nealsoniibacteriota TaxID=1817911 RepID=A0A2M7UYQ0_9BACT|nr:MAG: hypothetical protein COX36_01210 [Candidatus Nealsonbacteria bacterium CG23_combo_of_CG06-09_8_20_14_all_38_19]PIZ89038.1 MAG: hypothetical protein COX90_01560 [Candidatus Nealsonbacteria bacterium CG_4_10_14_0_2_um_filter_38_17]